MRPFARSLPVALPALTLAVALGASSSEAHAALFTVTNYGDHPDLTPGDGICVTAFGFCSLRAAIMESNALAGADTIDIPAGMGMISLYTVGTMENAAATGDLDISDTLTIVGNGVVIDGQGSDRIFHVLNFVTADISGVTIQNGWGGSVGGGIYNQGDLTLSDCTLTDNHATDQGGAIKNITAGSLVMSDCELFLNSADQGGAIYSNTDLDITDSSLYLNDADLYGGALYTSGTGVTTLTTTYFGDNVAGERGGGIAAISSVDLDRCTVEQNWSGIYGGGLYMYTDSAVVDAFKTDFVGNSAGEGGGIYNFWGDLTLRRVGVWNNSATTNGGGINNQGLLVALRGAIYDNTATAGAGIYNYWTNADLELRNMTVSGNDATASGGGLYVHSSSVAELDNVTITDNTGTSGGLQGSGTTTMNNTILGGNLDLGGAPSDCAGSLTSDGHNLIEDTVSCTIGGPATNDVYGVGPGLNALAFNGGRTPTHSVQAGSAARNAGDNATCMPVDQRGVLRPLGGTCEIGSYERN